jgi:hypothetical protein
MTQAVCGTDVEDSFDTEWLPENDRVTGCVIRVPVSAVGGLAGIAAIRTVWRHPRRSRPEQHRTLKDDSALPSSSTELIKWIHRDKPIVQVNQNSTQFQSDVVPRLQ